MIAKIVDKATYDRAANNLTCIYNRSDFAELNKDKVKCIRYVLVYKDSSPRFGCIFGENEGVWACPFSSPFGYIEPLKPKQSIENYEEALNEIELLARQNLCRKICFTFPPDFYDPGIINTWYVLMINHGWTEDHVDLNFELDINKLILDYEFQIQYNARRNLRIARKFGLNIKECESETEKKQAYDIIKQNRTFKKYPLRMSEKQVLKTMEIVPAKFYVVNDNKDNIASALIYDVTRDVAQIIYWGDVPGVSNKKPINYLGYELLREYAEHGFSWLDIGPSSEGGMLNYGLCDFKDSIGCQRTAKFKFYKILIENN